MAEASAVAGASASGGTVAWKSPAVFSGVNGNVLDISINNSPEVFHSENMSFSIFFLKNPWSLEDDTPSFWDAIWEEVLG